MTDWVYECYDSEERERPVCRSLKVDQDIKDHEKNLRNAIDEHEYYTVDKALKTCQGIDIDVKLRKKAEILHIKLQHELRINTFLKDKVHHDNYKDIMKDIQRINLMVEDA